MDGFRSDRRYARELDEADPLAGSRERFIVPSSAAGEPVIYFCGNSLGLQPKGAAAEVERELKKWAEQGVDGHFCEPRPWLSYHQHLQQSAAAIVGAEPSEVVMMNTLTVNLHLLMVSFYRPTASRFKILIDTPAFPSDLYAVKSQIALRGFEPEEALILATPAEGEQTLCAEAIEVLLERRGEEIALVLFSGLNYYTGQAYPLGRLARAARAQGCIFGLDLAHAVGNVPLQLHDWGVDFAAWCNYKYLNGGPGAIGGCFVHRRYGDDLARHRLAGWWGNEAATRFEMHLRPDFVAQPGAAGWQLSTPPVLAIAPLHASLAIFDELGLATIRAKSLSMTAYLEALLDTIAGRPFEVITPRDAAARGAQLSLLVKRDAKRYHEALLAAGVVCDFRPPDVIRVAPAPLYNTFDEIWRFARVLSAKI